MTVSRFFRWIRRNRPISCDVAASVHSEEQLKLVMERERARADRTGDRFPIISFDVARRDAAVTERLVGLLKQRLRTTDEIGWLDAERIGVILPSTPVEGATRVAEEVTSSFSPRPRWEVFCYPTDAPPSQSPWDGLPLAEPQIPLQDSGPVVQPAESFFLLSVPLWKRCLDIVGAGTGLALLSPVLALAALAIKLTSPGPVLFKQKRSGQAGSPFVIYKLRTMVQGAESQRNQIAKLNERDGPAFKIKADPRVTTVGRVLRALGIDEIPQLLNVLKGDMSLVGPRPLPCNESDACQGWRRRRLEVKPGITCIWQISQRSRVSFDDWVRMDLQYARSRSLLNDVRLMLQTVPAALSGRPAK